MNKPKGWDETYKNATENPVRSIPAGGYICRILNATSAISTNGNEMLVLSLDIAEGEHKDIFRRQYAAKKATYPEAKWGCVYRQLTIDSKTGETNNRFATLIKVVEKSNPGYSWNFDENTLKGKQLGMLFGEEEFVANDGSIKCSVKPMIPRSVQAIHDGDYAIPERKCVNTAPQSISPVNNNSQGMQEVTDDELPF